MSDHVDGSTRRSAIRLPTSPISSLYTSPENPARTVLAMCVFPSAGESAVFSNVIDYAIAIRRVTVGGVGNAAKFVPANEQLRLQLSGSRGLERDATGKGAPARRLHSAGWPRVASHGER